MHTQDLVHVSTPRSRAPIVPQALPSSPTVTPGGGGQAQSKGAVWRAFLAEGKSGLGSVYAELQAAAARPDEEEGHTECVHTSGSYVAPSHTPHTV